MKVVSLKWKQRSSFSDGCCDNVSYWGTTIALHQARYHKLYSRLWLWLKWMQEVLLAVISAFVMLLEQWIFSLVKLHKRNQFKTKQKKNSFIRDRKHFLVNKLAHKTVWRWWHCVFCGYIFSIMYFVHDLYISFSYLPGKNSRFCWKCSLDTFLTNLFLSGIVLCGTSACTKEKIENALQIGKILLLEKSLHLVVKVLWKSLCK